MLLRTLTIKLHADLYNLLDELCKNRGENKSTFVRRTIKEQLAELGFLSKDEQKALGVGD